MIDFMTRQIDLAASIPTGRYTGVFPALLLIFTLFSCTTSTPASSARIGSGVAPTAGITGKVWRLGGYRTEDQYVTLEIENGSTAKIIFSPDNTFEGTTGVNTFVGSWNAKNKTAEGYVPITLNARVTSSKKAPNDIAARYERDILADLGAAKLLKTEKGSLRLLDARKGTLLEFVFIESY
jgi:hypothetical protein